MNTPNWLIPGTEWSLTSSGVLLPVNDRAWQACRAMEELQHIREMKEQAQAEITEEERLESWLADKLEDREI